MPAHPGSPRPADNDHTTETWHQPWCSPASAIVPGGQAGFPRSPSAVLAAATADDVTAPPALEKSAGNGRPRNLRVRTIAAAAPLPRTGPARRGTVSGTAIAMAA